MENKDLPMEECNTFRGISRSTERRVGGLGVRSGLGALVSSFCSSVSLKGLSKCIPPLLEVFFRLAVLGLSTAGNEVPKMKCGDGERVKERREGIDDF